MRRLQLLLALAAPAVSLLASGCSREGFDDPDDGERIGEAPSELSQALAPETEPNGNVATATPIATDTVVRAHVFPNADEDLYSFQGAAGDRVYAAAVTSWSSGGTDSLLDLIGPDGTTVIESDNDNGSLSALSSALAGTTLTQTGTHYLRVKGATSTTQLRPYDLHVKTRSGAPVAETEPNDGASPQALPASGWVSGTLGSTTDIDVYTLALNAGDTVYASLDLDPERDGTDTNAAIAIGLFSNLLLQINDAGATGPDAEAHVLTVKSAGTYAVAVTNPGAATGSYHLSVSVHPAQQGNCTTYTAPGVPVAIPTGPGVITSTITIPGNPRIADIDVSVNIDHANPPDLDVSLQSPQGTIGGLFTDVGSSTYPNLNLTLDDEAAFPVNTFTVLNGLMVQPETAYRLDWFDGMDAGGTWTLRINDDASSNAGTLNGWSITVCEPPPAPACAGGAMPLTPLDTDFEANDGGFVASGTAVDWAYGTPSQAPSFTACRSGTKCFKTNLTGNYSTSSSQDLVSPPVDLSNAEGPIVASWAMRYQIENASYDPAWVDVREVGGANPRRLWQWMGSTMSSDFGGTTVQEVAGWGMYTADISAYAGKNVELVFHLSSDTSVVYPGLVIDDVKVSACPAAVCGNGTAEPGEACDDGNLTDGDGCDSNCTVTACGNGVATMGEACDDGNTADGDGCDSNCTATACGNGITTTGEVCDDGNATNGDGCDSNCTVSACGNGVTALGEGCDDGNLTDGDGCDSNCTMTACGNGIATMGEACDDGNAMEGDGCDSNCTASACGNGVTAPGEGCDDGNLTDGDGCDSNCTMTACGNGVVTLGEMCDDGNGVLGDGCDDGLMGNCTPSVCGNGVQAGGEGCDDGNLTDGDGCDSNCTVTGCGNGILSMGEDCDDGNPVSGDGCDANCTVTACGNGVQTDGEACDDGNLDEGDGCDTNCTVSACGNGVQAPDEACDDGNATDGDGCDANCTVTACGNGVQTDGEACDDGNADDGDGCDSNCTATACGNGIQTEGEDCDDGNTKNGDGCSADCKTEGTGGAGGGGAGGTGGSGGSGGSGGATGGSGGAEGGAGGGGGDTTTAEGGCGCRVAGDDRPEAPWAPALGLLGLGLLRLRRRR